MDEDQISPDEVVFRRISAAQGWVRNGEVDPAAFLPNKGDAKNGVSLARVSTAREAAATGRRGKKFYAVSLRVREMQAKGLVVISDTPTHAFIKDWIWSRRDELEPLAEYLSAICGNPEGPFDGEFEPLPTQ